MSPIITIILIVAAIIILLFAISYVKAPPDTAYIITGPRKQRVLIGRAGFRIPFLQRVDKLPLNLIQVDIKTPDAVPTSEFINIFVDGVANIKIGSSKEDIALASQIFLQQKLTGIQAIAKEVLEGNMREIIGQMKLTDLVHNRDLFAEKVKDNAMQDMARMGLQIINLTIQNFSDKENVIQNLGVDNITQIQKDAQIARANSERDVKIAQAAALEMANKASVEAQTKIIQQNTDYELKKSELKKQSDTAAADADAAYKIEEQKRLEEINVAQINADIAKREREVELGQKEVELQEKQLAAQINKKADAEKYATEQQAQAELFQRQRAAEAEKFELAQKAEAQKLQAEAEKIVKQRAAEAMKIQAEAERYASEQKALGIEAVGKAEAMKKMGEASVLQLILDSNVLPEIVRASSEPLAAAYSKINGITMYGEGNTTKLAEEITNNSSQIVSSVEKSLGIDLKSVLAGYLGGKLANKPKDEDK
ncbi:conserved surface-anchored protein Band 7 family [Firmicutes bacterium CAG:449]|nr:conserved surface-anchored protein Band 7 family [Firmicutes bacterium CAG:449]